MCDVGNRSLWSPFLEMVNFGTRFLSPSIGTRSLPVTKPSSLRLEGSGRAFVTSQNHFTACHKRISG